MLKFAEDYVANLSIYFNLMLNILRDMEIEKSYILKFLKRDAQQLRNI